MLRKSLILSLFVLLAVPAFALDVNNTPVPELMSVRARRVLAVPDILGLKTLKGDFHMHTMFSDGVVWPEVRVMEAWMDGLDAISVTDHLEKHPRKEGVKEDDNLSNRIAFPAAVQHDILLVKGAEITKDMPPGHYNALFVKDQAAIENEDFMKSVEEAINQGAFLQWNHPGWKAQQPEVTNWTDEAETLVKKGWVHGIEVFNSDEWYPVVLGWCMERNLAVMANSDMHGIIRQQYDLTRVQRPMTLIFAKERSLDALKEAMFAGRTVAWFGNSLAGKKEYLEALFRASVTVMPPHTVDRDGNRVFHVSNPTDLPFALTCPAAGWKDSILAPRTAVMLKAPKGTETLQVSVSNCHTNLNETLTLELVIPAKKDN